MSTPPASQPANHVTYFTTSAKNKSFILFFFFSLKKNMTVESICWFLFLSRFLLRTETLMQMKAKLHYITNTLTRATQCTFLRCGYVTRVMTQLKDCQLRLNFIGMKGSVDCHLLFDLKLEQKIYMTIFDLCRVSFRLKTDKKINPQNQNKNRFFVSPVRAFFSEFRSTDRNYIEYAKTPIDRRWESWEKCYIFRIMKNEERIRTKKMPVNFRYRDVGT